MQSNSIDPDDVVVAELDVVFSNELAGLQSQLVMLQQPLRPNWREYESGPGHTARFKPNARRLEMSLPLDTSTENYLEVQDEHKRIKTLELRSTIVKDPVSSYAVGVIKDNQLVLVPLDFTLQLRPSMSYLQTTPELPSRGGGKAEAAEESEEDEAAGEELTAVEVTVKRRETERQQQMRLKSYSYMQQEEQQEPWVPLTIISSDSAAADSLWNKLMEPEIEQDPLVHNQQQQQLQQPPAEQQQQQQRRRPRPVPLARTAYLNAFVPSAAGSSEYSRGLPQTVGTFGPAALGGSAAAGAAAGGGAAGAAAAAGGRVNGSSPSPSPGPDGMMEGVAAAAAVPDALRKAMRPVIKSLFKRYTVCSMANVRQWLQSQGGAQGNEASQMDDQLLHVLLLGSGYVQTLRRVYVAKEGPHSEAQGLRQVALEVLAAKPQIRKGDVVKLAKERGIPATDNLFGKVSKELCKNNGSYWVLKAGADM